MSVIVDLALATICFTGQCHPILVGVETPKGAYQLERFTTEDSRFGGDALVFDVKENNGSNVIFAIHRLIEVPGQNRALRIKSQFVRHRQNVTGGCINVEPLVFEMLVSCCQNSQLEIK